MVLQHTHFRAMIFHDFKSCLSQQQSHIRLQTAFGDEELSQTTVYDWFVEFRRGRRSLEDNLNQDAQFVEEDGSVTVLQIVEEVGISSVCVNSILHNSLGLSKVSARWMPQMLVEEQKHSEFVSFHA